MSKDFHYPCHHCGHVLEIYMDEYTVRLLIEWPASQLMCFKCRKWNAYDDILRAYRNLPAVPLTYITITGEEVTR